MSSYRLDTGIILFELLVPDAVAFIAVTAFAHLVDKRFTCWVANPGVLNGFINTSLLLMPIMFSMGAEQSIQVDAMGMFVQIIRIVILPIAFGLILNRFLAVSLGKSWGSCLLFPVLAFA